MLLASLFAAAMTTAASPAPATPPRVLVVTVTKGFRHDSLPDLEKLVADLAQQTGAFAVDYARTDEELAAKTTAAALDGYGAVVFASTTGDLPLADRDAFIKWVEAGHGFVGIHAATDTFHGYAPYVEMIGGEFERHGKQVEVRAAVRDPKHPSTRELPSQVAVFDEIYEFKSHDPAKVHLLLGMDAHPQTGAPGKFSLAWTRTPGKGRVFYTALGHRPDVIAAPWYREHVKGGLLWALGVGAK